MKRIIKAVCVSLLFACSICSFASNTVDTIDTTEIMVQNHANTGEQSKLGAGFAKGEVVFVEEECSVSEEEKNLLALVAMAEAEGECELGKRLVIDTILNRVDSEHFPDTISDVIYQPNQFTSMWNGRSDRCYIMDDIYALVEEELESRTNSDVVFFTAGSYGNYGDPMFQVENHYFSSY